MQKKSKINMVTSVKKFIEKNNNKQLVEMLNEDIFATDIYTWLWIWIKSKIRFYKQYDNNKLKLHFYYSYITIVYKDWKSYIYRI